MAKDILITPLDGIIQFSASDGAGTGQIKVDSDDLVISNLVGDVLLGDGASDVFIGNGSDNVDIVFEQNGEIRDDGTGKTLTIGSTTTTLVLSSSTDLTLQGGGGNVGIGTSTAAEVLEVIGNVSSSGNVYAISGTGSFGKTTIGTSTPKNSYTSLTVNGGEGGNHLAYFERTLGSTGAFVSINANSSDPQVRFYANNSARQASVGVDNTNGNFVIASGSAIAGNEAIIMDTNGNLFVTGGAEISARGTAYQIHIDGNDGSGPQIEFGTHNDPDNFMRFGAFGGVNAIDTKGRDFHLFSTAATPGVYFDEDNGKVGIGTDSPSELLHICGSGDVKIKLEADSDNSGEGDNPEILFSQDGGLVTGMIGFTSDNDFKISNEYNADEGDIFFKTKDTERVRIIGNGNVGIGTAVPTTKLQVAGDISASGNFILGDLGSGPFISGSQGGLEVSGSGITIHNGSTDGVLKIKRFSGDIGQLSAANTRFTVRALNNKDLSLEDDAGNIGVFVKDGGNVGIGGTTVPTVPLQVEGVISASGGISSSGHITINSPASKLLFRGDDTSVNHEIESDGNLYITVDDDNDDTNQFIQFRANGATNLMKIQDDGKVGIGTTSPSKELTVAGDISASGDLFVTNADILDSDAGSNPRLRVGRQDGQHIEINVTDNDNTIKAEQYSDSNFDHKFILEREFEGSGANDFIIRSGSTDELLINKDGNVGIGTTAPTVKLQVEGEISSSGGLTTLSVAESTLTSSLKPVQGTFNIHYGTNAQFTGSLTAAGGYGEIMSNFAIHTEVDKGDICYNIGGTWRLADADSETSTTKMLGVALANGMSADGQPVLIRGVARLKIGHINDTSGDEGDLLYLSNTGGKVQFAAPSDSGEFVRIVGYCLQEANDIIYFDPDKSFVEVA